MKRLYFFSILFLLSVLSGLPKAYGQLDMSTQFTEPVLPASQSFDFIKHGFIGSSLYTGTVNYSIPVYTYKDTDFEIPISLDYSSNGHRANVRPGSVGLDWILNLGGRVTREVRGVRDEGVESYEYYSNPAINTNVHGYYRRYNNHPSNLTNSILYRRDGNRMIISTTGSQAYENDPDIFHFNFMGYSGSFQVTSSGVVLYNLNEKSIGMKASIAFDSSGPGKFTSITFTTADGYKYIYNESGAEYNISETMITSYQIIRDSVAVAWNLSKIVAPNKREAVFLYINDTQPTAGNDDFRYSYRYDPYSSSKYIQVRGNEALVYDIDKNVLTPNINTVKYLAGISIAGSLDIGLEYNVNLSESYLKGSIVREAERQLLLLNRISIWSVGSQECYISGCDLEYSYSEYNNPSTLRAGNMIPFLSLVSVSKVGIYNLEYEGLTTREFPYLGTWSYDYWGYYNGKNDGQTIRYVKRADLSYDSNYNETVSSAISTNKAADPEFSKIGMLKKITYPTGGYTSLQYEPHDYSREVKQTGQTGDNSYLPTLSPLTTAATTGGMRIKKISNYSAPNVLVDEISYQYKEGTYSSGILQGTKRYGIKYDVKENSSIVKTVQYYSTANNMFKYDKTHIEYSKVTEVRSDGSKIVYQFTTNKDFIDEIIYTGSDQAMNTGYYSAVNGYRLERFTPTNNTVLKTLLTPPVSKQSLRGKVKEIATYDASGNLQRRTSREYGFLTSLAYPRPMPVGEDYRHVSEKGFIPFIKSEREVDYFNGDSLVNARKYTYTPIGLLKSIREQDSKGDSLITEYLYVTDNPTPGTNQSMINVNFIGYPIQINNYIKKSGSSTLTLTGGQQVSFYNPYSSSPSMYKPAEISHFDYNGNSWYTKYRFTKYNNIGNLVESLDRNGIRTSYIWGYSGLYPLAILEDVSVDLLTSTYPDLSQIGSAPLSGEMSKNLENQLRTDLTKANITTYIFRPGIGVIFHIDPSGKRTSYRYYDTGELAKILDDALVPIKSFYYSTVNSNY